MNIESMTKAALTRLDDAAVPSAEVVLARVAKRRRRRTVIRAANAAVAMILVVAGVAVGVDRLRGHEENLTPPPGGGHSVSPTRATRLPDRATLELPGGFVDDQDGAILTNYCFGSQQCSEVALTTHDGGRTWQGHPLPPGQQRSPCRQLKPFDRQTLVYDGNCDPGTEPADLFLSRDGGNTWQDISAKVGSDLDQVPPGARTAVFGTAGVAVLTSDNVFHWLTIADVPDFTQEQVIIGRDGTIIAFGNRETTVADPTTSTFVRISTDGGASWQEHHTSIVREKNSFDARMYTVDGKTMWFHSGWDASDDHTGQRQIVYVSHDSGITWSKVDISELQRGAGTGDPLHELDVANAADGGFILASGHKTVRVEPGTTVARTVSDGNPGTVQSLPGGVTIRVASVAKPPSTSMFTSHDGITWTPLNLPPV